METNAEIAVGRTPQAYLDASRFVAQTKAANPGGSIFVTGHSQGGGGAEYSAVQNNIGGASFGGPGIPNYTDDGSQGNFKSYVNYGDLIGTYAPVGGGHVGSIVFLGNPLDLLAEAAFGPYWGAYIALANHALNTYAVNILGPDTPTPTPFNIQKMMDDPFGTFGSPTTSQFSFLPDGTLLTTYKAADGTLLGNTTQNIDGSGSVSLFATSGQSWTKETGYFNSTGKLTSAESLQTDGGSERTVFDTGTEAWSSETSEFNVYQRLQSQRVDFDNGSQQIKKYDPDDNHPYKQLDITKGPNGQISEAQLQLEANIIAAGGSVGQIFGSALGRALAPNNQFAQLAVGTVAGLIGQKLLQTFTASLTLDASRFIAGNFASVTGLEVANAGLGAISSFLTAELGHELGLTGFGAELFNAGVGGVTGSVLTQVATKVAAGYSFDAAIGLINWGTAATQAGYNISSAAGSFLAHQFVHPESHEGAVGGQLLGAVGSALGLSAVLNATITGFMGFLIPGLGSLFGTIIGTMLGDAIAGDPAYPKAYHDVRILGSDIHFTNRLVGTDDHGNAAVSQEMGDQVAKIANSYLDAVHFANATDAIQEGVRELLVNTEVIGGNLLMKRAHQAFINGSHPDRNRDVRTRGAVRAGGWRRVQRAGAGMTCIRKRFA